MRQIVEQRISQHGRRYQSLRIIPLGMLLIVCSGCGLESPKSPQWSVSVAIPIADRHVDGAYLAAHADIEFLKWTNDSGLVWRVDNALDTIAVRPFLKIANMMNAVSFPLDDLTIGSNISAVDTIALSDLTPGPVGFIASFSGTAERAFPPFPDLISAQVRNGRAMITIDNQLGIDLDSIVVALTNDGESTPFATVPIPGPIASGDAAVGYGDLDGVTITNTWRFALKFFTPGGTILSAADKYAAVTMSLPDGLTVDEAEAVIDGLATSQTESISFIADHQFTAALFDTGSLRFEWTNATPLSMDISWVTDDLSQNGQLLSDELSLAPFSTTVISHDLAGWSYQPSVASNIQVNVSLSSPGSNGDVITITSGNGLSLSISSTEIALESATGQFAETVVSSGDLVATIDWDEGLQSAGLADWNAALVIASSLPLDASVTGVFSTNTGLELPFNGVIAAGKTGEPSTSVITIATMGEQLVPLPSEIHVTAAITFGGDDAVVNIRADDFFVPSVRLDAAAGIYVDEVEFSEKPQEVELLSAETGDRSDRLIAGAVTISVTNAFPLGAQFVLYLAPDSDAVVNAPTLILGPQTIEPARSDDNGVAISPRTSELTLTIDAADVALFERDRIWISHTITLLGPGNGQPARLSVGDYLDWNATAHLEIRAGGQDEDQGTQP